MTNIHAETNLEEKFHFFWDGPFSQWHSSPFKADGKEFNCCEQWMMAWKAIVFNDEDTLRKIMKSDNPAEQKALGRKVKNFDSEMWNSMAKGVVRIGNILKFKQNSDLREYMMSTGTDTIVEASPYDRIWGIGLSEDDPRAQSRSTWRGLNWLGEVLTMVKSEFFLDKRSREIVGKNIKDLLSK